MSDEILERIEKQMEGSNLALAAVADVLNKMDGRLSKADQEDEIIEEQKAADIEKSDLIKSIATEVLGLIKADNGLDVDGSKVRSGKKIAQGGAADDSAATVDATRSISEVQGVIQAMQKEETDDDEDDKKYPHEERSVEKEDADDDDDEKSKGGYGTKSYDELTKQLEDLQKQLGDYETNISKQVQSESEERLRKMGFKEETGLTAPKQINYNNLGTDGTTPLVKADAPEDTVDQLVNLSYKELRSMQTMIQAGQTDGIPRELLG
tara:strand:+ start:27 stop:824 length:798 start_codon:yes stop_codon:yes gene_type:complete